MGVAAQLLTYALAGRLQRDDTDQLGHEILSRVYAGRSWSEILRAVLYTFVHWTSVGRITPAAVLLGYLDRHDVHHSIGVAARQQAADVIHQHPEASASIAIGRSLDRDELVAYTLEHLSRADLDVVAGPERGHGRCHARFPVSSNPFFEYDATTAARVDEPFLATCSDEEWRSIAAGVSDDASAPATRSSLQGASTARALLIILDGELQSTTGSGRKKKTLSVSPPGAVVGEIGFLDGLPRSADVVATTDGELLRLTRADFDSLAAAEPALGRLILSDLGRIVAIRVRKLTDRLAGGG